MNKLKHYSRFLVNHDGASSSAKRMRRLRTRLREERLCNQQQSQLNRLDSSNHNVSIAASETVQSFVRVDQECHASLDPPSNDIKADKIAPQIEPALDAYSSELPMDTIEADPCRESLPNGLADSYSEGKIKDEDFSAYENASPLCSHTECTSVDVLIMCLTFAFRYQLPWVAVEDLLKMFNYLYGEKKINTSKTSFLKHFFKSDGASMKYHYFCERCGKYLQQTESSISKVTCELCKEVLGESANANYFVSLSFEYQLKTLLSNDQIAELIMNYRFSRVKQTENNLEDIYDGSQYKELSKPGGILYSKENFSYSFFTDGVAVGKITGRKKSLWPIYVSINELPPKQRRENILLVGLYYGSHDPNQSIFLKPFVDEANKLASQGFSWVHQGTSIHSKVVPLVCIADSVARCQLLNLQSFNAYYGCTFCYHKTSLTNKKLKFVITSEKFEERSLESYRHDLMCAYERRNEVQMNKRQYRGVKGPSPLSGLLHFNIFTGVVVDSMHSIFLGVCKTYFELVFDFSRRKFWTMLEEERYAMEDVKSEIDNNLLKIQPPTAISRTPRSIKECCNWKANEWRSWLLVYCIPCLDGLLKKKYLNHLALLCKAGSLLFQSSVSIDDVNQAHNFLLMFSFYYQKYFGNEYMFYNIHLLSHICKGVLRYGPLNTHNAFMYEAYNRNLLQLCKNPYRVVKEVSKKYLILRDLPLLSAKLPLSQNSVFYCREVLDLSLVRFRRADLCVLVGAGKSCNLDDGERDFLLNHGLCPRECLFYNRMILKGSRITTSDYAFTKKNNDSVVFSLGHFYEVLAIFVSPLESVHILARNIIVSDRPILSEDVLTIDHIRVVEGCRSLTLLKPDMLDGQCIYVKTSKREYVARLNFAFYDD